MTDEGHVGNGIGADAKGGSGEVDTNAAMAGAAEGANGLMISATLKSFAASVNALGGMLKDWYNAEVSQGINTTSVAAPVPPPPTSPSANGVTVAQIPDELLAYFHELRMTDKDLERAGHLMKSKRTAFCSDVAKVRESAAALVEVSDLKGPNLRQAVLKMSSLLDGRDLRPHMRFFAEIGLRSAGLVRALNNHEILKADVDDMRTRATFLTKQAHVANRVLPDVVAKFPRLLLSKVEDMNQRVEFFREIGLTDKGLGKIFSAVPQALSKSIEDLQAKYDLLVESGLGDQETFVKYPPLLLVSLAERYRPRLLFLQKRGMRRDAPGLSLLNAMKGSDDSFAGGVAQSKLSKFLKFKRKLMKASGGDAEEAAGGGEEEEAKEPQSPAKALKIDETGGSQTPKKRKKVVAPEIPGPPTEKVTEEADKVLEAETSQPERSHNKKKAKNKRDKAAATGQTEAVE